MNLCRAPLEEITFAVSHFVFLVDDDLSNESMVILVPSTDPDPAEYAYVLGIVRLESYDLDVRFASPAFWSQECCCEPGV